MVDLLGRKPLMIFFNFIILLGGIISVSSINIWITGVGLFLMNCGADGAMKMSFNYLAEYYDPQIREIYSIMIQPGYTLGYLLIRVSNYFIRDWRIIAAIFIILPALAGFTFCVYYLKEIPRYLVKKGVP